MLHWMYSYSFIPWLCRVSTMAAPLSMHWVSIRHRPALHLRASQMCLSWRLLPAPALGLLTSALAVPGVVLGSILETNALPDFSSSPSVPTGEHIQPSSVTSGEHGIVVPKGCRLHVTPDIPCLKNIIFPSCNSHFKQASIKVQCCQTSGSSDALHRIADAPKAREALKLLLSPEGQFFREFITSEVVLSIDAMSRTQLAALGGPPGPGRHQLARPPARDTSQLVSPRWQGNIQVWVAL